MKKRIIIFSIIALGIAFLSIVLLIINNNERYQPLYIYETSDEIIDLFETNISDFDEYIKQFHNHDMWDSYYEETKDSDFVNYKGFKKYTTTDEFGFLDTFYNKYHPTFWGRKSLGFYVKSCSVELIKDTEMSDHTQLVLKKAEESDSKITYYDNGWICIIYSSDYLKTENSSTG